MPQLISVPMAAGITKSGDGHHRPHGRNAAGVKVRRGTGFADRAMALRVGNRGEVQQLTDGLCSSGRLSGSKTVAAACSLWI
jgi:hypothetical protein